MPSMADYTRITRLQPAVLGTNTPERTGASAGFRPGREAQAPVSVTQPMNGDEFQRAVARFNKKVESDAPLRSDVPRGFYLNIRV